MPAKILDGRALAKRLEASLRDDSLALARTLGRAPALAVVLVGDDPASAVYVRNKSRACERTAIDSKEFRLAAGVPESELLALIDRLNADEAVDGILVQLPLPPQIDPEAVIERIDPAKDVDGFHVYSAGALMTGRPEGFRPCTPLGVMKLIEEAGCSPAGKEAVVIGRSNIVGKPQALMLLEKDATVTLAHSRTANLKAIVQRADIVIAAAGRPKLVTKDMVKPGAVVIDVGINRGPDGKLCGDVDPEAAEVAGALSPVPGGVGPMTIAMLMANTIEAAKRRSARARTEASAPQRGA